MIAVVQPSNHLPPSDEETRILVLEIVLAKRQSGDVGTAAVKSDNHLPQSDDNTRVPVLEIVFANGQLISGVASVESQNAGSGGSEKT